MSEDCEALWLKNYGSVPHHLTYDTGSMYGMVHKIAEAYPRYPATFFMGGRVNYDELDRRILLTARALLAAGVRPGERVLICLPNLPQTVHCFYALNRIGAVAAMLHPLATAGDIQRSANIVRCRTAIVLDLFLDKFAGVTADGAPLRIICVHVSTELRGVKRAAYRLLRERKAVQAQRRIPVLDWPDFMAGAARVPELPPDGGGADDPAVVIFTGGSTGTPKGALLSNLNLNAMALQTVEAGNAITEQGSTMLAIMPMFHGFGLGVGVHTALGNGGASILIPRFTPKSYIQNLRWDKPNYIAGVPALFDAMIREPSARGLDLSFLKGVFSGGDAMTPDQHRRVNEFLDAHGSPVHVREGYGLTESVSANCLTPEDQYREGSIGVPYPDVYFKIVKPGTAEEVPVGREGEICISGPSVMLGYVDQPQETADALRRHSDGRVWLHTGDLGRMDGDGYFYFIQRIKRIIVTNGYNVYPSQVEQVLEAHPLVDRCCVVGVPDEHRGQRVQAYIQLIRGTAPSDEVRRDLSAYISHAVAAYAKPRDLFFTDELPTTLVGKVDFYRLSHQGADSQGEAES